jgi:hypothetical protein
MVVACKHVEPMPSASQPTTLHDVNVYQILLEIQLLHANQVSIGHLYQFSILDIVCMIVFLSAPLTEPSLDAGCASNDECPDYTACENRQCINPCAKSDPCAALATCKVISHQVVCTCPDGYIGSPEVSCQPRKKQLHDHYLVKTLQFDLVIQFWEVGRVIS